MPPERRCELVPVQFREKDSRGRVSLVNFRTSEYLEEHGILLSEGVEVHLCQPVLDTHGSIDWEYARARVTYDPDARRWMADLLAPVGRASEAPADHWSKRIRVDLLGPLPGDRFLDLDAAADSLRRRRRAWRERGLLLGQVRWLESTDGWNSRSVVRAKATKPHGISVSVRRGDAEGRINLRRAGLAHVEWWDGELEHRIEHVSTAIDDLEAFDALVDRQFKRWV